MSRKKEYHEEHADETWLLPYSDLLTLLLALFIVMFAISSVDKEKFEELKQQFNIIFSGGSGIMEKNGNSVIPMESLNTPEGSGNNDAAKNANVITSKKVEEDKMNEIKKKIEKEIDKKGYSERVKVTLDNEGLEISIQDAVLFNSGEAEIIQGVYPLLLHISEMIKTLDNSIKIAGHTDNVPIRTSQFRSNWDLSSYRAINVMNFMVEKGKLDPKVFSIQAYGEYKPKFDNSTEAGRTKNRRVEIFIERKYPLEDKDTDKNVTNKEKQDSTAENKTDEETNKTN